MSSFNLPTYDQLPVKPEHPPHSAWGVWPEHNERGTINLLTKEAVKEASKEIQSGDRVSLDWQIGMPKYPYLNRCAFKHEIIAKNPRIIHDDIVYFNTQQGSQWDSLRHYAYQEEKVFYGGVTQDEIVGEKATTKNGIQIWSEIGIAGRGVLLDFGRYAKKHNIEYSAFSNYGISVEQMKAVAKDQNLEFKQGDILLVRTGHIGEYATLSDNRKQEIAKVPHTFAGVKQGQDTLEWIWNTRFAAVAADNGAFEATPPIDGQPMMHPVILSGFGCPIGELFDLEKLSVACEKHNRWSFFLTSAPLNVPGGVASPPNAIAVF